MTSTAWDTKFPDQSPEKAGGVVSLHALTHKCVREGVFHAHGVMQ